MILNQSLQNPLIKEYTLNFRVYSLIKGFWRLWEASSLSPPMSSPSYRRWGAKSKFLCAGRCITGGEDVPVLGFGVAYFNTFFLKGTLMK